MSGSSTELVLALQGLLVALVGLLVAVVHRLTRSMRSTEPRSDGSRNPPPP